MRVVIDTSVWMAAIRSRRGASFALLSEIGAGRFQFGISTPLFLEYEAKLLDSVAQSATPLSELQVRAILAAFAKYAVPVPIFFRLRPNLRDEGDNFVFECAAHFGARHIVTHNIRDFRAPQIHGYSVQPISTWRVFRNVEEGETMKTLQVRLPDSVHNRLKNLAQQEGVSLNQMLVTAASNEVIRSETHDFFAQASANYDPQAFAQALAAVPDVEPIQGDEL